MKWIILVFELYPPETHFKTLQSSVNTNSFFFLSHGESPCLKKECMQYYEFTMCAECLLLFSLPVWKGDWPR